MYERVEPKHFEETRKKKWLIIDCWKYGKFDGPYNFLRGPKIVNPRRLLRGVFRVAWFRTYRTRRRKYQASHRATVRNVLFESNGAIIALGPGTASYARTARDTVPSVPATAYRARPIFFFGINFSGSQHAFGHAFAISGEEDRRGFAYASRRIDEKRNGLKAKTVFLRTERFRENYAVPAE